ncbi:MAG TPA: hypothetical protein VEI02_09410, partial [Planctomycetota bacterium]|nr:hypothetical protein [Planctomycetota bacterium]
MRKPVSSAVLALAFFGGAAALASGQAPATPASKGPTLYVRVGRIALAPGDSGGGWIRLENGVLAAIERAPAFRPPEGAETLELDQGWATPTFVHPFARALSDGSDADEGVTAGAVAADLFDPFEPRPTWAATGVAHAFVASGFARLVPGQGSVVRLHAADPLEAVAVRSAALRINLGEAVRSTPELWKPPILPGPEDPFRPAVDQGPKTRGGAAQQIRALFRAADAWRRAPRPLGPDEPDLRPFAAALEGKLPVRVAADRYADVASAIQLSRELGFRLVIEGGNEAWKLADELAAAKASVVLRLTFVAPTGSAPFAPVFLPEGEGHPDAHVRLRDAGVPIAFMPPEGGKDEDLWFYASRALRPGVFSEEEALAATTWTAARLCGLPFEPAAIGRPAEIAIFAGSPFEATAR